MSFTPKDWHDSPLTDTRVDAAALIDIEERLSAYADAVAAGGVLLGASEITSFTNITSTSFVDFTPALSVTVTTGSRPVAVILRGDAITCAASPLGGAALLRVDGTDTGLIAAVVGTAPLTARRELTTLTPGSHTFSIRGKTTNAGSPFAISAGNGSAQGNSPIRLSVVQL